MEKQFEIINIELYDFVQSCIGQKEGKVVCHMYLDEYKHTEKTRLQAELMNDALNVHFETGFSSSELLRQNREMKEALNEMLTKTTIQKDTLRELLMHPETKDKSLIDRIKVVDRFLDGFKRDLSDCLTSCAEQGKE